MHFDEAYTLKNWCVSSLLLPRISNENAAELTDHFSSSFVIGLTRWRKLFLARHRNTHL